MKNYKDIFSVIGWLGFTACLILIILLLRRSQAPGLIVEKSTIKIYDSTEKRPAAISPPMHLITYTLQVPAKIDTQAILKNFFSVHVFEQVYQDSSYRATIIDTICQNRIKGRLFSYRQLSPVKTIESTTVTIREQVHGFYLGAETEFSRTGYGFGPSLSYLTKKNLLIHSSLDLVNRSVNLGVQFPLYARDRNKNK